MYIIFGKNELTFSKENTLLSGNCRSSPMTSEIKTHHENDTQIVKITLPIHGSVKPSVTVISPTH